MQSNYSNRNARATHQAGPSRATRMEQMAQAVRTLLDDGHKTISADQIYLFGFTPSEVEDMGREAIAVATTLPQRGRTPLSA